MFLPTKIQLRSSNLEHFSLNSPKQFWDELKSLGPKKKNKKPKECYTDDGIITSETDFVRNVWKSEFAKLYNPLTGDNDYNETFLQHARESVSFMENNMLDPLRGHNPDLNRATEINENVWLLNRKTESLLILMIFHTKC